MNDSTEPSMLDNIRMQNLEKKMDKILEIFKFDSHKWEKEEDPNALYIDDYEEALRDLKVCVEEIYDPETDIENIQTDINDIKERLDEILDRLPDNS